MITKEEAEKAYADLIQLRRSEVLVKDKNNSGKVEIHHIIPISCKGTDADDNKIALYAKEHFMAHTYLWVIHHDDEFHYQTMSALNMMINGTLKGCRQELREFILASEEYQKAREELGKWYSENIPDKVRGEKNGVFGMHWYKDPNSLSCKMFYEGEQPKTWIKGYYQTKTAKVLAQLKKFSQSVKGKISIYNTKTGERKYILATENIPSGFEKQGRHLTEDEKKRISDTLKAKTTNNPEYRQKKIDELRPLYAYYLKYDFEKMKADFSYKYTFANFIQTCKTYLPEYVKHQGKKTVSLKQTI